MALSDELSAHFTPASALAAASGGGVLALATMAKLRLNGNILGISGIAGGILKAGSEGKTERLLFTGGLAAAGVLLGAFRPDSLQALPSSPESLMRLAAAGLLLARRVAVQCLCRDPGPDRLAGGGARRRLP